MYVYVTASGLVYKTEVQDNAHYDAHEELHKALKGTYPWKLRQKVREVFFAVAQNEEVLTVRKSRGDEPHSPDSSVVHGLIIHGAIPRTVEPTERILNRAGQILEDEALRDTSNRSVHVVYDDREPDVLCFARIEDIDGKERVNIEYATLKQVKKGWQFPEFREVDPEIEAVFNYLLAQCKAGSE